MSYDVLIRKNATGEVRKSPNDSDWKDSSLFWWTEGNFGCDCNRYAEFERAGGRPEDELMDEDWECGHEAYSVLKAILADGTEIPIDEPCTR